MTVNFRLQKVGKYSYIYIDINHKGRYRKLIERAQLREWRKGQPHNKVLRAWLDHIEDKVIEYAHQSQIDRKRHPSKDEYDHFIKDLTSGGQVTTLWQFCEEYLTAKKKTLKPDTYRTRKSVINIFKKFDPKITWSSFDKPFFDRFTGWLIDKGRRNNTIGTKIRVLKMILNEAVEYGHSPNPAYKKFAVWREDVDNIWHPWDELDKIDKTKMPDHLREAADVYLIGCFTLLRFRDYGELKGIHIKDNQVIKRTSKTSKPVAIPIYHPIMGKILSKYKDKPFPEFKNQVLNRHLKEIGELAGINEMTEVVHKSGGKVTKEVLPKYEFMITHTARRSGATNLYLLGVDLNFIKILGGWATIKQMLEYIKADHLQNAQMFKEQILKLAKEKKLKKVFQMTG